MQPRLRFKEFKKLWQTQVLSNFIESIQSGKSTDRCDFGRYPLYGSTGSIGLTDKAEYSGTAILIARVGANAGSKYLVEGKYSVTDNTLILKLKDSGCYLFFSYLLEWKKLNKLAFGSGQPLVTGGLLKQLELNIPDLSEQTKIASFLSAVDERISQLIKKYELLTQYKKGVAQKIFSQELRFKSDNGSDYSDWVESSLGKIGSISSGAGFPDAEQGGCYGVPFYKVSDMNLESNTQEMKTSNNYVSEKQIIKLRLKPITKPAIIFAKVGAAIFLERKRKAQNFLIDNNMMAFIPNFDINFAKHLFDSIRLAKFAQVGALPSYNASDISTIKVSIPSTEEQTMIAGFLSAIDDKINNIQYQLKATKQYKQGLLQQMLI